MNNISQERDAHDQRGRPGQRKEGEALGSAAQLLFLPLHATDVRPALMDCHQNLHSDGDSGKENSESTYRNDG